ncbi:MAG: ester cyclase [Chitinophagaceae bacterium]|jgi:predicted ester cyclase|nr:ester cyclase [Chitinophagaceae bacterium]OQY96278.1 MAG: hypothetical protein B6D37_01965 [Sphingobacteriales bacterium UTBCD1]
MKPLLDVTVLKSINNYSLKQTTVKRLPALILFSVIAFASLITSCSSNGNVPSPATDSVAANIKMYTHTWDEIINHGKLDLFNDSSFTKNVVMHAHPDIVGIVSARAYYANYLTGFSNISFTIIDVFGQGDKLVKHWRFEGKHTGNFFGIPATGKDVSVEGATLVKMRGGKIAEEQNFIHNYEFII